MKALGPVIGTDVVVSCTLRSSGCSDRTVNSFDSMLFFRHDSRSSRKLRTILSVERRPTSSPTSERIVMKGCDHGRIIA